ncbi:unnamed protein product [Prorocentrum cordatum]|uniref:Uncharacterized protein n=1 Tax=Prorocentrum cordatum TaxID=2364126 RepID=A0ABN9TJB6_9DINO|nr:unnamed protein product [Polarella glacialis]
MLPLGHLRRPGAERWPESQSRLRARVAVCHSDPLVRAQKSSLPPSSGLQRPPRLDSAPRGPPRGAHPGTRPAQGRPLATRAPPPAAAPRLAGAAAAVAAMAAVALPAKVALSGGLTQASAPSPLRRGARTAPRAQPSAGAWALPDRGPGDGAPPAHGRPEAAALALGGLLGSAAAARRHLRRQAAQTTRKAQEVSSGAAADGKKTVIITGGARLLVSAWPPPSAWPRVGTGTSSWPSRTSLRARPWQRKLGCPMIATP